MRLGGKGLLDKVLLKQVYFNQMSNPYHCHTVTISAIVTTVNVFTNQIIGKCFETFIKGLNN